MNFAPEIVMRLFHPKTMYFAVILKRAKGTSPEDAVGLNGLRDGPQKRSEESCYEESSGKDY